MVGQVNSNRINPIAAQLEFHWLSKKTNNGLFILNEINRDDSIKQEPSTNPNVQLSFFYSIYYIWVRGWLLFNWVVTVGFVLLFWFLKWTQYNKNEVLNRTSHWQPDNGQSWDEIKTNSDLILTSSWRIFQLWPDHHLRKRQEENESIFNWKNIICLIFNTNVHCWRRPNK